MADHEQSSPENRTRVNVRDHVWSSSGIEATTGVRDHVRSSPESQTSKDMSDHIRSSPGTGTPTGVSNHVWMSSRTGTPTSEGVHMKWSSHVIGIGNQTSLAEFTCLTTWMSPSLGHNVSKSLMLDDGVSKKGSIYTIYNLMASLDNVGKMYLQP